ncbi:hypothetical protein LINGRAHAP2_LOCUS33859, partial [Linum grandiflorum]
YEQLNTFSAIDDQRGCLNHHSNVDNIFKKHDKQGNQRTLKANSVNSSTKLKFRHKQAHHFAQKQRPSSSNSNVSQKGDPSNRDVDKTVLTNRHRKGSIPLCYDNRLIWHRTLFLD